MKEFKVTISYTQSEEAKTAQFVLKAKTEEEAIESAKESFASHFPDVEIEGIKAEEGTW